MYDDVTYTVCWCVLLSCVSCERGKRGREREKERETERERGREREREREREKERERKRERERERRNGERAREAYTLFANRKIKILAPIYLICSNYF